MKPVITLLTTILLSTYSFAQSDSARAEPDTTIANKSTLTLGVLYANNASYYGQRAQESMPYIAASATWQHRSGFYITGMGYKLLKEDTGSIVSASSLGAGITFNLSKTLSADISYSHTFFPSGSPFLQAANADNISASLTLNNWLSTSANVDYAFGKTQDVFVTLGTGKFINLGSLFSPKDFVSLTPAINIVGGTQHFYETYVKEKKIRDSVLGIVLPPVFGGQPPGRNETETTTTTKTSFDLLSYNLKLPLAYNRASYLLEVTYQLSVLGKEPEPGTGKTNSFFTLSFYYQF